MPHLTASLLPYYLSPAFCEFFATINFYYCSPQIRSQFRSCWRKHRIKYLPPKFFPRGFRRFTAVGMRLNAYKRWQWHKYQIHERDLNSRGPLERIKRFRNETALQWTALCTGTAGRIALFLPLTSHFISCGLHREAKKLKNFLRVIAVTSRTFHCGF